MSRPLLVIDGDSFAHRAYHALPKSIRRRGNRGGGAIVGSAGRCEDERVHARCGQRDGADKAGRPAAYDGHLGGYFLSNCGCVCHWRVAEL